MNKTSLPSPTNPSPLQSKSEKQHDRDGMMIPAALLRLSHLLTTMFVGVRGVVWAGGLSAAIYAIMVMGFPMYRWWFHPDDTLSSIAERSSWTRFFLHLGPSTLFPFWLGFLSTISIVALFALQMFALSAAYKIPSLRQARKLLIGFPILFILILIWLQPMTSSDLYGYLARAYLIADLHRNPLISLATMLPGGYLVPHARPPAPYGPVWLLLMGGVGYTAGEHLFIAMMLDKLLTSIATIASIIMVAWLAEQTLPGQRLAPIILMGWSPLLLFEAIGNGHNDIVMMAFVLASLVSIQARKPLLAFPLLALGVLIKYSVGALVPAWSIFLLLRFAWKGSGGIWPKEIRSTRVLQTMRNLLLYWRQQIDWRVIGQIFGLGGLISIGIAIAAYAPFWAGLKSFTGLGQQLGATYFFISPIQFVFYGVQAIAPQLPAASTGSALRFIFYGVFAIYALSQAVAILQHGPQVRLVHLIHAAGNTILAILLLITFWYQPWYIVWLVPLAALVPIPALRRNMTLLALGGMLTYPVQHFAFFYTQPSARDAVVQFTMTLVAFGFLLFFHQGFSLRKLLTERYQRMSHILEQHPALIYRMMLALVLISAVLLRLVNLGSPPSLSTLSHSVTASLLDASGFTLFFSAGQSIAVLVFGQSAFALLLPAALIGTLSVWMLYLLASQIFIDLPAQRHRVIGIIVAILVATSQWFVVLARLGTHVTILPTLIALASIGYWRIVVHPSQLAYQRWLWIALSAISLGAIVDLEAPLLPIVAITASIIGGRFIQSHRKQGFVFVGAFIVSAIPTMIALVRFGWTIIDPQKYSPLALTFWIRGWHNVGTLLHITVTQDYSTASPIAGSVTAVPWLLLPFSIVGGIWLMMQWRSPFARLIAYLFFAPFIAIFVSPVSMSIIAVAAILPVVCLLPAIGLELLVNALSVLLTISREVRASGVLSDEGVVQVALLLFVILMTVSAFVWFFAQTVPGPTHLISPV